MLRALNSSIPPLRQQLIQLCCAKEVADQYADGALAFEQARGQANIYTSTLHVINSGVVKTSKLTYAGKVYRGISGMVDASCVTRNSESLLHLLSSLKYYLRGAPYQCLQALPTEFWKANDYGVRGGIEAAFMSTTANRDVAMQYAKGGGKGVVIEIQQGMIDRGADIKYLSQYPHEAEILFVRREGIEFCGLISTLTLTLTHFNLALSQAPLTGLEVASTHVDGALLIMRVKLSINLTALTIEQVISKRYRLLEQMCESATQDLRRALVPGSHFGYTEYGSLKGDIEGERYEHIPEGWSTGTPPKKIEAHKFSGPFEPPDVAERLSAADEALRVELLEAHKPDWWNDDALYSAGVGVPLMVKQQVGGRAPMLRVLQCTSPAELRKQGVCLLEALQAVDIERTCFKLLATRLRTLHPLAEPGSAMDLYTDPAVVALRCRACTALPAGLCLLKRLEHIELTGWSALATLPDGLIECNALLELDLHGCASLRFVPDSLSALTSLQALNLGGCSSLTALPEVSRLVGLTALILYGCSSLRSLPIGVDKTPLSVVELVGCTRLDLATLPQAVVQLNARLGSPSLATRIGPPPERQWEDEWVDMRCENLRSLSGGNDSPYTGISDQELRENVVANESISMWHARPETIEAINHAVTCGWPTERATIFLAIHYNKTSIGRALQDADSCYAAATYAVCDAIYDQTSTVGYAAPRLYTHLTGPSSLSYSDSGWRALLNFDGSSSDMTRGRYTTNSLVTQDCDPSRFDAAGHKAYDPKIKALAAVDSDVVCFESHPTDQFGAHSAVMFHEHYGSFPPNTTFATREIMEPGTWEAPGGVYPMRRLIVVIATYLRTTRQPEMKDL